MFRVRAPQERSLGEDSVVAQLLTQSDFGRVVAGDRHRLDRGEEVHAGTRFPAVSRPTVWSGDRSAARAWLTRRPFRRAPCCVRPSTRGPSGRKLARSAGASARTPSMKRSTSVARAPGVSVCGMIELAQAWRRCRSWWRLRTFGVHPARRLRSGGNRRVRVHRLLPREGAERVDPERGRPRRQDSPPRALRSATSSGRLRSIRGLLA